MKRLSCVQELESMVPYVWLNVITSMVTPKIFEFSLVGSGMKLRLTYFVYGVNKVAEHLPGASR